MCIVQRRQDGLQLPKPICLLSIEMIIKRMSANSFLYPELASLTAMHNKQSTASFKNLLSKPINKVLIPFTHESGVAWNASV